MTNEKKSAPIKGSGKKGGTIFPRIALSDAIDYARKVVAKTHISPQHRDILFPGVFGSNTPHAEVKASALKQYGLLEGKSEAYTATALAKKINSAPKDELQPLYAEACLHPKVFSRLHETFHSDKVPFAKLKQQAAGAEVHPDFQEMCANLFVESVEFAGLGKREGDTVELFPVLSQSAANADAQPADEVILDTSEDLAPNDSQDPLNQKSGNLKAADQTIPASTSMRSVVHVNISLDSSLDTDKLEKQLALLRRYGAL